MIKILNSSWTATELVIMGMITATGIGAGFGLVWVILKLNAML